VPRRDGGPRQAGGRAGWARARVVLLCSTLVYVVNHFIVAMGLAVFT